MNYPLVVVSTAALLLAMAVSAAERNEKTVFVTSDSFDSNLGGLAGADAKCQAEADGPASIVPSGTFLAWLSDGTNSPNSRFTKSSHPYVLPNGTRIAENYTDLTDGSILNPINLGAHGKPIGYQTFWTGTRADGSSARSDESDGTCGGWAMAPPAGKYGMSGHTGKKTSAWTNYHGDGCISTRKLACFQQ